MPRYELSGEYFWTIELADRSLTTRLGRIGNAGHARVKTFGSAAEAKRAHDQLVAEKLEQGYALVAEAKPKKATKAAKAAKRS